MDAVYALGRVAVIVIFLALGVSELANIDKTAELMQTLFLNKPFISNWWPPQVTPTILAAAVAGLQVVCGLLVLFGYWTRTAAFFLLVGTIGYFVFANELFTVEAARKMLDQNQALNLSLIGALLMLTAAGAGGWSVDGRARPSHGV